jgi:hypothetical protein
VQPEGLGKLKKKIHPIGTRTRDLPVCSIVPQPTTLPRAHFDLWVDYEISNWTECGVHCRHLSGSAAETHEELQLELPVSQSRFEPFISRIVYKSDALSFEPA